MRKITVGNWQVDNKTKELVNQVLESGRISYGPLSQEFEQKFSSIHNCNYGVVSNSGTSSLQVALQALKELHGWNDGDEIIVPAVTFVATVNIVLQNNLKPVLVDVDRHTYNIDPELISEKITDKTRAIIPVHVAGLPADMAAINEVADIHNLKIIEDSCECAFTSYQGQMVGSMSDIGVFSFYIAHLITTGVGGMSTTNNEDYANKMRSLVNHGWNRIRPVDVKEFDLDEVKSRYHFPAIGHSYRITEFEAALGLSQLNDWKKLIKKRRDNAMWFGRRLGDFELREYLQLPDVRGNVFMFFPLILKHGSKWKLISHLEQNGIETRELLPLINQPCYKGLWNPDDYPIAQWIGEHGFYVGCHQYLEDEDIDYMVEIFRSYFK